MQKTWQFVDGSQTTWLYKVEFANAQTGMVYDEYQFVFQIMPFPTHAHFEGSVARQKLTTSGKRSV